MAMGVWETQTVLLSLTLKLGLPENRSRKRVKGHSLLLQKSQITVTGHISWPRKKTRDIFL